MYSFKKKKSHLSSYLELTQAPTDAPTTTAPSMSPTTAPTGSPTSGSPAGPTSAPTSNSSNSSTVVETSCADYIIEAYCKKGGTCVDTPSGKRCDCVDPSSGDQCEFQPVVASLCVAPGYGAAATPLIILYASIGGLALFFSIRARAGKLAYLAVALGCLFKLLGVVTVNTGLAIIGLMFVWSCLSLFLKHTQLRAHIAIAHLVFFSFYVICLVIAILDFGTPCGDDGPSPLVLLIIGCICVLLFGGFYVTETKGKAVVTPSEEEKTKGDIENQSVAKPTKKFDPPQNNFKNLSPTLVVSLAVVFITQCVLAFGLGWLQAMGTNPPGTGPEIVYYIVDTLSCILAMLATYGFDGQKQVTRLKALHHARKNPLGPSIELLSQILHEDEGSNEDEVSLQFNLSPTNTDKAVEVLAVARGIVQSAKNNNRKAHITLCVEPLNEADQAAGAEATVVADEKAGVITLKVVENELKENVNFRDVGTVLSSESSKSQESIYQASYSSTLMTPAFLQGTGARFAAIRSVGRKKTSEKLEMQNMDADETTRNYKSGFKPEDFLALSFARDLFQHLESHSGVTSKVTISVKEEIKGKLSYLLEEGVENQTVSSFEEAKESIHDSICKLSSSASLTSVIFSFGVPNKVYKYNLA